ncbi:unnamed protein product [Phytophthora fragariaefolia]|uniref:Unnamed protein product n=1 Tax=Phytophthora fragariaefolia TaxID=1490495 RepID=A0A9W6XUV7_9STRA|nr:unnamed protein product [Phytophthora fragariaefolia]
MQRHSLSQASYQAPGGEFYGRSERHLEVSNRYRSSADAALGAYASVTQTRHQLQHQSRQHHRASSSSGSSLPVVAAAAEMDEEDEFALQLLAYRAIYVLQGAFMGMLGPGLVFFSALAEKQSGMVAPVYGFGPIFAAHGGAALVMSFMSDFVLTFFTEKDFMKQLIVVLLLGSGAWYACLTPVAAATGNVGVGVFFIAKGFWTALLNITYVLRGIATAARNWS